MDKFGAMEVFVRVVETGSFSAVARKHRIGQPAVSKLVFALETELGTELLHRNSRSVSPTEAGSEFYHSAQRILEDFESAASRIGRCQTAPNGLVRVAVPPSFARLHMVTKLAAFFEDYPEITVEFGTCESPASLIEDGFDLFIHSGDLPDSGLVARRFAQTLMVLVGTPRLVSSYGLPRSIDDLKSIPATPQIENGAVLPWEFGTGLDVRRFAPFGSLRCGEPTDLAGALGNVVCHREDLVAVVIEK
jgi:LysR family transcriptional regulator for bpeEF and oprC